MFMRWLSSIFLIFSCLSLSFTVAVSIRPMELIVKEFLPDEHKVVCLMPEGTNPHLYQLKASDLKALNEADLIVLVGFEEWAEKVQKAFPSKTVIFGEAVFEKDFEEDVHLWLDPVNVLVFSHRLVSKLSQIDPNSSKELENNWTNFSKRLFERLWVWYEKLQPLKGKPIVEVHPALVHFAKRFGLGQIFALETGHEEGLTTKKLAELTKLVRISGVRYIFVDEHVESSAALKLAKQLNLEPITIDLMGWQATSYVHLIDSLVERLTSLVEGSR